VNYFQQQQQQHQNQLPNQAASIALVCSTMKRQIISRAFYGWLAYCRHLSTVRTHLSGLVHGRITPDIGAENGLTEERWRELHDESGAVSLESEVYRLVYYGGVAHDIRKEVWPYLLGHYIFGQTPDERKELDENTRHYYETTMSEWLAVEAIVRQLDKEKTAHAVAKLSSGGSASDSKVKNGVDVDVEMENEVFEENGFSDLSEPEVEDDDEKTAKEEDEVEEEEAMDVDVPKIDESLLPDTMQNEMKSSPSTSSYETVGTDFIDYTDKENLPLSPKINPTAVIVTDASVDIVNLAQSMCDQEINGNKENLETVSEELSPNALQEPKSACVSPASSNGGIYSVRHFVCLIVIGSNSH
jgi:small G protein signaling modulator 1